jgi:hypothetical protein
VSEHLSVRDASRYIFTEQTEIKSYRRIEIVRCFISYAVRTARPHFAHF